LVVPSQERKTERTPDYVPSPSTELLAPTVGVSVRENFAIVPHT